MKDKIIFIDDQETIRHLFGKRLQRLFGDLADIIPLEPKPTTEEMVKELMDMKDVCSYIIDENLTHTGSTNYQGVNLIEKNTRS